MNKSRLQERELHTLLIPPVINPISTDQAFNFIPVGLLALLSTMAKAGLRAAIYKPEILIMQDGDIADVARDILSWESRSVGFSTWCDSFPISLLLAEEIKRIDPEIPVIFGGPQASILTDNIMEEHHAIDFILRGEADHSLPGLLSLLMNGKEAEVKSIPGIVYRDLFTGEVMSGSPDEIIKDLDILPVPAYEKIIHKSKVRIDAGRGCPYPCTYCTTNQFFSKKYRVKSPGRILSEMEYCHQALGISGMGISHDMFTLSKAFMEDFTGKMLSRNMASRNRLTWTCSARTDCVTEDMLDAMQEGGCTAIFFGIESGSERIQKEIRKNLDIREAERMIAYSSGLGMVSIASYMAGYPGENKEDLNDTLRSILNVAVAGARPQLTMLSFLPGTPIYHQHADDLEYDEVHSGFSVAHLTEQMRNMIKGDPKSFSSFYHLPNDHISRQIYLFLADLVNNIEHFLPTLGLLREHIRKSVTEINFVEYIEKNLDNYRYGPDTPLPELYFLTDSLKQYLKYLHNKGLPPATWDVFQLDFTKAFMIAEYERWQMTRAGKRNNHPIIAGLASDDKIIPHPYWRMVETYYYLYDYMQDPVGLSGKAKFHRGHYHYIVLPVSHRMARLIKVPVADVQTYRELSESTVEEFIRKNVIHLGDDRTHRILKKMIQWGLVEIEKK